MPDLGDLLAQAVESRSGALAGETMDVGSAAALRGYVQHRRSVRRVRQAMVLTPVVAALVLGGWTAADRWRDVPPAVPTPTASSTVTATPRPTPTPTPSPTAALVALPEEGGLPSRYAAPDDLLERAEPGWVLAIYEPSIPQGDTRTIPSVAVAVLASPDGTAYELSRWAPGDGHTDRDCTWFYLVSWRVGDTTALVNCGLTNAYGEWTLGAARLDLRTGMVTDVHPTESVDGVAGDTTALYDSQAQVLTLESSSGTVTVPDVLGTGLLSPDGHLVAVNVIPDPNAAHQVVDVTTGAVVGAVGGTQTADGNWCREISWWTSDSVLELCADANPYDWAGTATELHLRLVAVPATTAGQQAGSEFVVAIEEGQSVPSVAVWVADREVVWEGCTLTTASLQGHSCADGVVLLRDGAVTPLSVVPAEPALTAMQEPAHTARQECGATVFRPQSAGGHFVVAATNACWADVSPSVLLSYDSQTLAPTVVLDLPYGTFGADQTVAYTDGPTSWVLGR